MRTTTFISNTSLILRLAALTVLVTSVSPVAAQVTITCPPDITVSNDTGVCSAVVEYPAPVVTGADTNAVVTSTPASGSEFPVGTNEVVCAVTEGTNTLASCSFLIVVEDKEPPEITDVWASKRMLWPPNHKMVKVTVNYRDRDNCDPSPDCILTVTSDEDVNGLGDGNTSPDWRVLDAHHVLLRAERSGNGGGRTYTITITCVDQSGNSASEDVTVVVPHSRGQGNSQVGNGNTGNGHGNPGNHGNHSGH